MKPARVRISLAVLSILVVLVAFAVWFMTAMPGARHRGLLQPLGVADQQLLANLKSHVAAVASEEHNVGHPEALERSARYIEAALSGLGYAVSRQEFETQGVTVRNLEVRRAGPGAGKARLIVIGAHYDSAQGAVGADDNGSGVAALIELARLLESVQPAGGLEMRLVFYVNEELPWFGTEKMGSLVHASGLALGEREVVAMLSLETIGWYSDAPGSQRYPFPFNLLYPSTGDFIGFVANRYRAFPLPALPYAARHAGQARLRRACAGGAGPRGRGARSRDRRAGLAALSVPDVAHEALPAARLLREGVLHLLRFAVACDGLLHLLVNLAQGQSAWAFQLVWIVFSHSDQRVRSAPYAKLAARSLREFPCPATPSACFIA